MAKKIKFPLELANGVEIRTLEQLKENFDLEKIIEYFLSGKLQTWLEDRYYEEEVEALNNIDSNDSNLKKNLCTIFNIEYNEEDELDIEEIERRNKRIAKLSQYTDDEQIIKNVDNVAFNQEELADLLDNNVSTIYFCDEQFTIPLRKGNMTYIGIFNPVVRINSKEDVDFDAKNIILKDLTLKSLNQITIIAEKSTGLKFEGNIKNKEEIKIQKNKDTFEENFTLYLKKIKSDDNSSDKKIGLYKSNLDGNNEVLLSKETENVINFCRYKNFIFYVCYNCNNSSIYKIDLNIINKRQLICISRDKNITKIYCTNNWIIWNEGNLLKISNFNGGNERVIGSLNDRMPPLSNLDENLIFKTYNNYLFFIEMNYNDSILYKINLTNLSKTTIDFDVVNIDISEKNLYYVCKKINSTNKSKYMINFNLNYDNYFYEYNLEKQQSKLLYKYNSGSNNVKLIRYENNKIFYKEGSEFILDLNVLPENSFEITNENNDEIDNSFTNKEETNLVKEETNEVTGFNFFKKNIY